MTPHQSGMTRDRLARYAQLIVDDETAVTLFILYSVRVRKDGQQMGNRDRSFAMLGE
jgi:hypothetical protein